ncbi:hypothetical protein C2S53_000311 [Perilla frutescens var. hirtella]|uniref:Uncharacterized protein n=1 Tax=Perilla frutescens var. hirtella TaxID=608512 RepID=A0AAD4JA35_PERFH|nr:hypothetical protein C2S53_000311 [Perilla frutescens var. hirtella]
MPFPPILHPRRLRHCPKPRTLGRIRVDPGRDSLANFIIRQHRQVERLGSGQLGQDGGLQQRSSPGCRIGYP